jgi:hypothetical protein
LQSRIIEVTSSNIDQHPQAICFINPKHDLYHIKVDWLRQQFKNGLRIKMLYIDKEKKPIGFVEYVRGEQCWRSVEAKGYMFIHCLWTNGKKYQHQGLGTILLKEVEKDSKDMQGVTVVTSDKSFMTNKAIFLKNGYTITAESGKDQLLTKQFRDGSLPSIRNWQAERIKHKKWTFIYSNQCPWVARFIEEVRPILNEEKLDYKVIELKTAREAQKAPSLYGTFNLIYNGKLLADRYISITRFKNIINKELKM